MSAISNGKSLSMHNDAIWKGTFTHNGTLLKIHENDYTIGYSALLKPDGSAGSAVKFGDGVFYDAHQKNNKVYVGKPTVASAVPVFAGIVVREPAIASGYPAINDEVSSFQKGLIAKEGYIVYKEAYIEDSGALSSEKVNVYENETIGTKVFVQASDGAVYFGTAIDAGDTEVGRIVEVNPDDKSVTVYISPAYYLA